MVALPTQPIELTAYQRRVMAVPEEYDLFLGGGRGGGKSFALAFLFMRHAEMHGPLARMLFCRQSFPGIQDFELTCREVFGKIYGAAARYNASSHLWRLPNGATLQLEQIDGPADFQKFQGKSFTLIAVDEGGHWASPQATDLLRSCLRGAGDVPTRFVIAANPGGPGHAWITQRHQILTVAPWRPYAVEYGGQTRTFVNCPATFRDNAFINQAEYAAELAAACATDPELLRAWDCGDWSVQRGAYFAAVLEPSRNQIPEFDPRHLNHREFDLFLAHDFGSAAPSVTYVCAESAGARAPNGRYYPRGSILLLDELATNEPRSLDRGMGYTVPVLADRIREMCQRWEMRPTGVADDACFAQHGSAAGSIADEFKRAGVYFYPARKGGRIAGWAVMRRMLQDAGSLDRPGLYIARHAEYFWATVPALPRDPRHPEDVDSRAADHAADAARYALGRQRHEIRIGRLAGR